MPVARNLGPLKAHERAWFTPDVAQEGLRKTRVSTGVMTVVFSDIRCTIDAVSRLPIAVIQA